MPLGSSPGPLDTQAPTGGLPASLTAPVQGGAPITDQYGLSDRPLWAHELVDTTGGTDPVRVTFEGPIDVLEVAEYDGTVLYIGLGRVPSATSYDLKHPGNGEIRKRIPGTRTVWIVPAAATPNVLDVIGYAGVYALD